MAPGASVLRALLLSGASVTTGFTEAAGIGGPVLAGNYIAADGSVGATGPVVAGESLLLRRERELLRSERREALADQKFMNLAVFFDGAGSRLQAPCSWPAGAICETNVATLWRMARNGKAIRQLTFYEPGVGSPQGEDSELGYGLKLHALSGYRWLADNYHTGDKIFLFGLSRSALSVRYLQGMIHRIGLAKGPHKEEAIYLYQRGTDAQVKAFRDSEKAWYGPQGSEAADIAFAGLFDAVLRTNWHPVPAPNISSFHLGLTSSVKELAHAIALSEYRASLAAHELKADPSTATDQVWFMGTHADVGGGYPSKGPSNIALGWMADKAEKAGLLLPGGWAGWEELRPDFEDDVHVERGIAGIPDETAEFANGGDFELRDPAKCSSDPAFKRGDQRIKMHKSVKDRMDTVPGWVPLPLCCQTVRTEMEKLGINWVQTDHYYTNMKNLTAAAGPQWIKVKVGQLLNVKGHEIKTASPFFVQVQSWIDDQPLTPGKMAPRGCCTPQRGDPPPGAKEQHDKQTMKNSVDFTGLELALPFEGAVSNKVIVEVFEDDLSGQDGFRGRVELRFDDDEALHMMERHLSQKPEGPTLEVQLEFLPDDHSIEAALGGGNPAQCLWLFRHTGSSEGELCDITNGIADKDLLEHGASKSKTCASFLTAITHGV